VLLVVADEARRVACLAQLESEHPEVEIRGAADRATFLRFLESGDFDVVIVGDRTGWVNEVPEALKGRYPNRAIVLLGSVDEDNCRAVCLALEAVRGEGTAGAAELRRLFENVPLGLFRTAPDGRILDANPALWQLFGCPDRETVLARNAIDSYADPADRDRFRALLERDGARRFEARLKRMDGSLWWGELSARAVRDSKGQILYHEGSIADITARREAEEAQRESEERFRRLSEATFEGVLIHENGIVLDANTALETLSGYSLDEVRGQSLFQFVAPESQDAVRRSLAAGDDGPWEAVGLRKDGTRVPVELHGRPMPYRGRQVRVVAVRDISARKRAQEALLKTQERFELVSRATSDVVWDWNLETGYTWRNVGSRVIFGYSPEEVAPDHDWWTARIHPEDLGRVTEQMRVGLEAGETYGWKEYRFRRADGSYAWVFDRAYAVYDEQGKPIRVIGAMMDITERKRTEEALARSEERYRRFFEAGLAGAYVTSADGRILDCNQAFVQILGFPSLEQAIGASVSGLYPTPQVRQQILERLRTEKGVVRQELSLRSADGRPLLVMANMAPLFDEAGRLRAIEGYLVDITERRRLEEQLRQAQKMEAVGRLAGGIAHDFNNLLTAIAGYAELLLRHLGANDPLRKHAQGALDAADRATALTRQLLAFSRKQVLVRRPLDVNAVVADMEDMLRRVIGEDIHLVRGPRQSSWIVEADPVQLEQVLVNLAVNARDAMPQGGTLTIETADVELDQDFVLANPGAKLGPHVMLAVADTGLGMDDDVRSHLFEPFFTTKPAGKGTGLGLATVYGIVQQNAGTIAVDSALGKGTVFRICLPRTARPGPLRLATAEVPDLPEGAETILLVEDEDLVRELGRDMLRLSGYTVLEARHAGEALVVAERYPGPIHLLLTDVVMPDMNGRELAERLTAQRPDTKVLYVSGHTEDAVLSHGVETGEMAFLQKPFRADTLVRKIREVLET
jgi:PAS domain S-box-containing protein